MKSSALLLSILFIFTSCSGSKSSQNVDDSSLDVELADSEGEVEVEVEETDNAEVVEAEEDKEIEVLDDSVAADENIQINDEISPAEDLSAEEGVYSNNQKQYVVQKNETLMLIAFKLYGDYSKWREIAAQNPSAIDASGLVKAGSVLVYNAPSTEFVWSPSGNPYLIKNGDTLGTISSEVYQTSSKWRMIWENNRPMIKDPNKIYAGFTLYYLDGREVASEI